MRRHHTIKFHIKLLYLKNMFRCNYAEGQWEIGYTCTGIQNRYVACIGIVTDLHDCVSGDVTLVNL